MTAYVEQLRRSEKRVNLIEGSLQIGRLLLSNDQAYRRGLTTIDCVKSHAAKPVVVSTILHSTGTLHAGAAATKSRSNCSSSSRLRAGSSYSAPDSARASMKGV